MKKNTLYILHFLLVAFSLSVTANNIVYPWRATTAVVERGNSFDILFDNIKFQEIDSIALIATHHQLLVEIDSVEIGMFEFDHYTKSAVNNRIWANIPEVTPEELYDLHIYCGGEVSISPKSVKVVKQFNRAHSFIHISDLHVTREWVGTAEDGYAKELELLNSFIEVANIISPDFIIITGDNIMDYTMFDADSTGWNGVRNYEADSRPLIEERYKNLFYGANGFSGIYGFNSPTFLTPGNHDFYGVHKDDHLAKTLQWNKHMGKRTHGFTFAGTRVILSDDSLGDTESETPSAAIMSSLQRKVHEQFLEENGAGELRILGQHKHDNIDTLFLDKHHINILLNGHNHTPFDELVGVTPTLNTRPGVVCRSGEIKDWEKNLGFFRIFHVDGESYEYSEPLRFCQNPTANHKDLKMNLTLNFANDNNGKHKSNQATIENLFSVNLPKCKIRFVMEKGEYKVEGGEIYQTIEKTGYSIIDVHTDVKANNRVVVNITPKMQEVF